MRSQQEDLPGKSILAQSSKCLHSSIFQKLSLEKLHLLRLGLSFISQVEIGILHQIQPGEATQQSIGKSLELEVQLKLLLALFCICLSASYFDGLTQITMGKQDLRLIAIAFNRMQPNVCFLTNAHRKAKKQIPQKSKPLVILLKLGLGWSPLRAVKLDVPGVETRRAVTVLFIHCNFGLEFLFEAHSVLMLLSLF